MALMEGAIDCFLGFYWIDYDFKVFDAVLPQNSFFACICFFQSYEILWRDRSQ